MKQKGFAHVFLIFLLLAGLAVAVYLVQQKTNILPKAAWDSNTAPAAPTNVKGECSRKSHSVALTWDLADDVTYWYVRYRKSANNWWPNANSEEEQAKSKISAGVDKNFFVVKLEPDQQSLDAYGVYACKGEGNEANCSDFAPGEPVECRANAVTPTQTPLPTGEPTETPIPTPTLAPDLTPTPVPAFPPDLISFGYTCGASTAETIGATISWEPVDETQIKFLYGFAQGGIDTSAGKFDMWSTSKFAIAGKSITHYIKKGQLFRAELALADSGNNRISKIYSIEFICPKLISN